MNTHPLISLVFVNYQSVGYLKEALESLFCFEKERSLFEVIVVNNDRSETAMIGELSRQYPFRIIESGKNDGFGSGCNRGVKLAQGSIFGFINPDIVWREPIVLAVARIFQQRPLVGVFGARLIGDDGGPESWSAGRAPSLCELMRNNFPAWLSKDHSSEIPGKLSFPDWVSGGALFVRAKLFEDIGGFDERFFLYFEDVDLCVAARIRGFSVAHDGGLSLTHRGGRSISSKRSQKRQFFSSQKKYFNKRRPRWETAILYLLHFFRFGK